MLATAQAPDSLRQAGWYPWHSIAPEDPGLLGMNSWLEAPAGKYGRVERRGETLFYGGRPLRLWGLNNTFADCAPPPELAKRRAAFYAKYGVNSVRLHKYGDGAGWSGILNGDSFAEFDSAGLDRMDFFVAQLKARGIFVKLSPSFGPPTLMPKDTLTVPFLTEFGDWAERDGAIRVPHSAIFFSPEIQEVHIQQMLNLLSHRNPYTGLTYAEDPAIWDLEIVNEQSILFYTSSHGLERSPTLRRQVGRRFSDWLQEKYGSQRGLERAWGQEALGSFELAPHESLRDGTVLPLGNPYFWNTKNLEGPEAYRKQRHLDVLAFLTMLQLEFYERYVAAVRAAGYEGEISASNWQAGSSLSHFANLWTDAQVGTIDRHNYFGGSRKNRETGERVVHNGSMLARAGSGMLSSGMQQVAGLPFMLSEWIHVWPNEYGVEGPALIGAYGLGLQGWDVSYLFQNRDDGGFSPVLGSHNWDVTAPQVMGVFPAVARQVLRGDVAEAQERAQLKVHAASLFAGEGFDFEDQVEQGYDDKVLQTDKVNPAALAAARVEVVYTDAPAATAAFDLDAYREGAAIRASTGQLRWVEADNGEHQGGFFTLNSPGTQALVGFAQGQTARGSYADIRLDSEYGAVYLSALAPDATLGDDKAWLITAIGRARNTGMRYNAAEDRLLDPGAGPVLMEPVRFQLSLTRPGRCTVQPLDHDGRPQGPVIYPVDGKVTLDTGVRETPYFWVRWE
ncbi:MAG: hypothetical protein D6722_02210 [Bacteroidetes bacterium]|nr:MAG: hypothetical protein D6722_02210 [Bacteroidota bacterium]